MPSGGQFSRAVDTARKLRQGPEDGDPLRRFPRLSGSPTYPEGESLDMDDKTESQTH